MMVNKDNMVDESAVKRFAEILADSGELPVSFDCKNYKIKVLGGVPKAVDEMTDQMTAPGNKQNDIFAHNLGCSPTQFAEAYRGVLRDRSSVVSRNNERESKIQWGRRKRDIERRDMLYKEILTQYGISLENLPPSYEKVYLILNEVEIEEMVNEIRLNKVMWPRYSRFGKDIKQVLDQDIAAFFMQFYGKRFGTVLRWPDAG